MDKEVIYTTVLKGIGATFVLIVIYFTIVSLISGWDFAKDQFRQFWYFIITLAVGFGIQVGLYTYLRAMIKNVSPRTLPAGRQVVATTGATSTAAMISCCAHYLVNILPILGAVGLITVISQYQIQLFWIGLAFNFFGIVYMANKVYRFSKDL